MSVPLIFGDTPQGTAETITYSVEVPVFEVQVLEPNVKLAMSDVPRSSLFRAARNQLAERLQAATNGRVSATAVQAADASYVPAMDGATLQTAKKLTNDDIRFFLRPRSGTAAGDIECASPIFPSSSFCPLGDSNFFFLPLALQHSQAGAT